MINYGYFRHRFDASSDPKLQNLVDDMGICALGYYYSLLEMYGVNYAAKKDNSKVVIHRRVIANTWRKRVDSCDKVLTKLQLSGLLVYTKCENTYSIDIPNFSKYYGSYKKKTPPAMPNKSKENKSKEKESKVNLKGVGRIDLIQDLFNEKFKGHKKILPCVMISSESARKFVTLTAKHKNLKELSEWSRVFDLAAKSDFLGGKSASGWVFSLPWLFDEANIEKVLNGQFGANNEKKEMFAFLENEKG